jgi:hypothetical protein
MARRFVVQGNYGSVSAAQDVLRITAPTNGLMRLIECHVAQDADETSEMLPFALYRASDNGTGTAANVQNLEYNTQDSLGAIGGFSAVYNLSGATTKSPAAAILRESVNILSGFHFVPVPEARPIASGNNRLVVRLETAPTNTLSLSVYAVVEIEG